MHEFVAADVEGADDDAVGAAAFSHEFVGFVLLVFGGRDGLVEEKKFGTEETDAFGARGGDGVEFGRQFDIGGEDDVASVARVRRGFADGLELVGDFDFVAFDLAVFEACLFGGVADELAAVAVEQNIIAGGDFGADAGEGDNGRNAEGSRHDGAVRGAAALFGDEAADQLAVDQRGVGRREIARDDDVRPVEFVQFLAGFAEKVADDAAGDVFDVDDAFLQVGVIDGGEGAAVFLGDLMEDELDIIQVALESAQGFIDEGAVFDDEEVGIKDAGVVRPDGPGNFLLNLEKFLACGDEGDLEPGNFRGDFPWGDVANRYFFLVLPMDDHLALDDARGDAEALPIDFCFLRCAHPARFLTESAKGGKGECLAGSVLVEAAGDEFLDFFEEFFGIGAGGGDLELGAVAGGEHHETHNGLAVDFLAVLLDPDLGLEAVRRLDEKGRGAGVEPVAVENDQFAGETAVRRAGFFGEDSHVFCHLPFICLISRSLNSLALSVPWDFNFWSNAATSTKRPRSRPVRTGIITWGTEMPRIL